MITAESFGPLIQKAFSICMGLIGLGFLIGFHELGHFLFCKLFNIATPSFSIGFGPQLFSKKIGDTQFTLSALPFGGYVEIAGAAEVGQGEQQHAYDTGEQSFARKPFWQKLLVMLGGIIFNLMFAYFAVILLYLVGTPSSPFLFKTHGTPHITKVAPTSVAERSGLQEGDTIIAVNQQPVDNNLPTLFQLLEKFKSDSRVNLTVERNNSTQQIEIRKDPADTTGAGRLPGAFFLIEAGKPLSLGEALRQGIKTTNEWIWDTIDGFKKIFSQRALKQLGGPVMIIAMTVKGASEGFKNFLILLAIISISLAILNLIPLPILDGGQILFYSIEALIGRSLPIRVREYIHIATWIAFIILFLYLTLKDISQLFMGC